MCRPRISSPTAFTAVDYETLLRQSDVVSFHVVLNRETRYMFGDEQLKLMKPNAIVLNTARGKVLDEKALARAIDEGRLRGAAIDAFEEEPLPMDSPLRKLGDRVLLSPALGVVHRRGRTPAGRGVGHALGGHRTQGWHPGQCLQSGRAFHAGRSALAAPASTGS